jgi:hypothetical protein
MTIDERISTELRRHAPQVDEQAAWERFQSVAPVRRRVRAPRWLPVAAGALGLALFGFVLFQTFPWDPAPVANLQSPFRGTWYSVDADRSNQVMVVQVSGDGSAEVVIEDDSAQVCSGAASTMTGTGRLESEAGLVIPAPVLTCADGTEPEVLAGPPLEEQLRDLTFTHDPESDTLTDGFGLVWSRERVEDPGPAATEGMWPQSSLEEVQEAQELANAGDPGYTWQLAPEIVDDSAPGDAEIFRRFFQLQLAWDEYRWGDVATLFYGGDCASAAGCTSYQVEFVRCDVSRVNPLYPEDPEGSTCAPTIDEVTYETVTITVEQLATRGPTGIWVVTDWSTSQGLRQRVPREDVVVADALDRFLQARVDGAGAEEQVSASSETVPLLYAASNGSTYEWFEHEATPRWPTGEFDAAIRLYADGGTTVVEQQFTLYDAVDRMLLEFDRRSTVENGQPLPETYSILDGEVTLAVPPPWYGFFDYGPDTIALVHPELPGLVVFGVLPDPLPLGAGCEPGPAPADAETLARSILSDPDLEATEPVAARVGGLAAVQMDVVATAGATVCDSGSPEVLTVADAGDVFGALWLDAGEDRMRLYLVDLPAGSSARILAITFVAPEASYEAVLEYATPILDSFEFGTG